MCKMFERPLRLEGITVRQDTTAGHAYIIVNFIDDEPFEVFANLGKAGSEKYAMAEAIGRLISMVLRMDELGTRRDRANEVVRQLRGIGGSRMASDGTRSVPDAIGKALEEVANAGNGVRESSDSDGRSRLSASDSRGPEGHAETNATQADNRRSEA